MGNSVITMRGLCKSYQKQEVLHDFSLTVERGHICGLIGPNGAGKTTIMKILAGLFFPTKGEPELFGSPDNLDDSRARMSFMIEQPIIAGSRQPVRIWSIFAIFGAIPMKSALMRYWSLSGLQTRAKSVPINSLLV